MSTQVRESRKQSTSPERRVLSAHRVLREIETAGDRDKLRAARKVLGEDLHDLREQAGFSIEQLAKRVGTKPAFLREVEAGRATPTPAHVEAVLEACKGRKQ
jgi:ribosome-binding protein aMBF1 (putative translation factor)